MSRISKNELVHQDGGIQTFDIVALVHVGAPPDTLHVIFELDTHPPVFQIPLHPAVELAALKEKASPLAERDNLVHRCAGHRSNIPCSSCEPSFLPHCLSFC